MSKSTIYLDEKKYLCSSKEHLLKRSRIFSSGDTQIRLKGYLSKGSIEANTDNDLLIISSFFATHFSWLIIRISLILAFIPLLVVIYGIIS